MCSRLYLKTSASIQAAADRGDTKSVYDGIRKPVGLTKKLTSPLQSATREIIYNRDDQLSRWVQHFYFLYYKQNIVTDTALKHIESLPTMDDLDSNQL